MSARLSIVVGVTGGIAAYKAVAVIRLLVLAGHDVHVVATGAALKFVGRPTLEAISRNPVFTDLFDDVAQVRHVAVGQAADLIVIAPATANTIAKLAAGLADDLLGNTVLASTAPLVIAPAMHTEMWRNAATATNVATLRARGVVLVGPASGQLTGADSGQGRMEEPDVIVQAALAAVTSASSVTGAGDLTGRRILVSAGGTREALDPVRYLGNRSSGRQGVAIAAAASARGAQVTLVAAHLEVDVPAGVTLVQVESADQLRTALLVESDTADTIIMAAAVADFRPATIMDAKIKKVDEDDAVLLELVKNPDILRELSIGRREGRLVIGFAAETEPDREALLRLGRDKIARKGCDYLVVNRVGWNQGIGTASNAVMMLDNRGDIVMEASGSKMSVAGRILDVIT